MATRASASRPTNDARKRKAVCRAPASWSGRRPFSHRLKSSMRWASSVAVAQAERKLLSHMLGAQRCGNASRHCSFDQRRLDSTIALSTLALGVAALRSPRLTRDRTAQLRNQLVHKYGTNMQTAHGDDLNAHSCASVRAGFTHEQNGFRNQNPISDRLIDRANVAHCSGSFAEAVLLRKYSIIKDAARARRRRIGEARCLPPPGPAN